MISFLPFYSPSHHLVRFVTFAMIGMGRVSRCYRNARTIEVGFGALTGRPLALTGARVPAASAFLCSRWIWREVSLVRRWQPVGYGCLTLDFLEIGMVVSVCGVLSVDY